MADSVGKRRRSRLKRERVPKASARGECDIAKTAWHARSEHARMKLERELLRALLEEKGLSREETDAGLRRLLRTRAIGSEAAEMLDEALAPVSTEERRFERLNLNKVPNSPSDVMIPSTTSRGNRSSTTASVSGSSASNMDQERESGDDELSETHVEDSFAEDIVGMISQSLPIAVAHLDDKFVYRFVNEEYLSFVNKPKEQVLDHPIESVLPPESLRAIKARIEAAGTGRKPLHHISRLPNPGNLNEETIWEVYTAPGRRGGFTYCAVDITEKTRHAQELDRARRVAEAASQAKSQFLSLISHEIRTPLNAILGFTELLADTATGREKELVKMMDSSGRTLLALLSDVLDMAKIEANKFELEWVPFDFVACLRGIVEMMSAVAVKQGIKVAFEIGSGVPHEICADESRLKQVAFNLLGNAIKFTPSGGSVMLSVALVEGPADWVTDYVRENAEAHKQIEHEHKTAHLLMKVQDSGIGIPKEKFHTVFKSFTQVDVSITRKYGGTGLGLPVCRKIVELIGGAIRVDSELGKGTCFTIYLPVAVLVTRNVTNAMPCHLTAEEDTSNSVLNPELDTRNLQNLNLNILVAEDTQMNQIVIRKFLEKVNINTTIVNNGAEAVQAVVEHHDDFDLLLIDIQMPILDGYGATKQIREWESQHGKRRIPILALTALSVQEELQACIACGCDGYLLKPVSRQELYRVLGETIEAKMTPVQ